MLPFDGFVHPWVLLLLAVPLILIVFHTHGRRLIMPIDHRDHRPRRFLSAILDTIALMPAFLLAIAIVVLARPQAMQQPKAFRTVTNIQLCLDVSGSMIGPRYENASNAISDFTRLREGDAMGLTVFSSDPMRWVPITKDLQAIRNALAYTNPAAQKGLFGKGTAIGSALQYVTANIDQEAKDGDRLIILISDGQSDDATGGKQYDLAKDLIKSGCVVYYIHIANDSAMVPEVAELAQMTGGEGLTATDGRSLAGVFAHIDRMKPARYTPQAMTSMDRVRELACAALAITVVSLIGFLGLRYTPW